jgi:hypothetical protein
MVLLNQRHGRYLPVFRDTSKGVFFVEGFPDTGIRILLKIIIKQLVNKIKSSTPKEVNIQRKRLKSRKNLDLHQAITLCLTRNIATAAFS